MSTQVTVEFGRLFAREAGFDKRVLDLPKGATIVALLREVARVAPGLSCLDDSSSTVDLAAANLSLNGGAVDPRHPEQVALVEGDRCYLYGVISGG